MLCVDCFWSVQLKQCFLLNGFYLVNNFGNVCYSFFGGAAWPFSKSRMCPLDNLFYFIKKNISLYFACGLFGLIPWGGVILATPGMSSFLDPG